MQNAPEILYAEVSVRYQGSSIFDATDMPTSGNAEHYFSSKTDVNRAEEQLIAADFTVFGKSKIDLSIAGSVELYEQVFNTEIYSAERLLQVPDQNGRIKATTCYGTDDDRDSVDFIDTTNSEFADLIEGIAISEPVEFFANLLPPVKSYWHLNVPADVSLGMNANLAHRRGYTGK